MIGRIALLGLSDWCLVCWHCFIGLDFLVWFDVDRCLLFYGWGVYGYLIWIWFYIVLVGLASGVLLIWICVILVCCFHLYLDCCYVFVKRVFNTSLLLGLG